LNAAPTLTQGDSVIKLFLADGTTKTFSVDDDDLTNAAVVAKFDAAEGNGGTGTFAAGNAIIRVDLSILRFFYGKIWSHVDALFAIIWNVRQEPWVPGAECQV